MKVGPAEFLRAHSGGKKSASKLILVGRIQVFVVVRAGIPVTLLAVSLGLSVAPAVLWVLSHPRLAAVCRVLHVIQISLFLCL